MFEAELWRELAELAVFSSFGVVGDVVVVVVDRFKFLN